MYLEHSANSQQTIVTKEGEPRASIHKVKSLKVHDKKKNLNHFTGIGNSPLKRNRNKSD